MTVNLPTNCEIHIEPEEAFRMLCQTLRMEMVLSENAEVCVKQDEYGDRCVYCRGEKYDDRGDLFVALRNVAVNIFPNVAFRSADYIYNK